MLWLQYPNEHFYVRPDLYANAARSLLGQEPEGKGNLFTSTYYAAALHFARSLRSDLEALGLRCRDFIDVQGFLWGIFNRSRVWFGGYNYAGRLSKLDEFVKGGVYATNAAALPEIAACLQDLASLSKEQKLAKRAMLESRLKNPAERTALLGLFDLATRPGDLLLAKSVWYDRSAQRSMLKIAGIALTEERYSFDQALGHQIEARWVAKPSETVVLPSNLFPKVNSTLSWLSLPEALDAIGGEPVPLDGQPIEADESENTDENEQADVTTLPPEPLERTPYTIDQALDGLFLSRQCFERALGLWRSKKNLILQGPPGVGKSFVARRLAYALILTARSY
jgi:hypothetical protein